MTAKKRDNSALEAKIALRRQAIAAAESPVVLETHAGEGLIFLQCYTGVTKGWALEKDKDLLDRMTQQRERWFCYQCESEKILADAPRAFDANFIDVDPHGSPWPVLEALFNPHRFTAPTLHLVVHDGSRRFLAIGASGSSDQRWRVGLLAELAAEYGDDLRANYSDLALVAISKLAKPCGYTVRKWTAFYTGHDSHSTHYWATLKAERSAIHRTKSTII